MDYVALSRDLAQGIESGVYIAQSKKFVYVNPFFEKLTGYSSEELIGRKCLSLVLPKDRAAVRKKAIRNLKSRKGTKSYEYRFIKKNGEVMWVLERISSIEYLGQKATLGSFMDIDERKHLEEALLHSEERYRTIMEQMYDGYFEMDLDGNFTFVNDAVYRNLGYSTDEMVGKSYRFTTPEDDVKNLFVIFNQVYTTGEPHKGFAHKIRRKNGSLIFVESSADLRRNEMGEVIGFRSIVRDITERKQLEEELRNSEERYRTFITNSSEGIWRFEAEQSIPVALSEGEQIEQFMKYVCVAECNDAMARLYGMDRAGDLAGMRLNQFIDPGDPSNLEFLQAFIRSGYQLANFRTRITDSSGNTLWFINNLTGVVRNGHLIRAWGMRRDVTERTQAEMALKQSEERYRALFDHSLELVYIHDFEGNFTDANNVLLKLLGYQREDILSLTLTSLIGPDQSSKTMQTLKELKETGAQQGITEYRVKLKDGTFLYLETQASVIYRDGKPYAVQGIARDITDRKQLENALIKSEERYRTILQEMQDSYFEVDLKGKFTFVNESTCRDLGYPREELMGNSFRLVMSKEAARTIFLVFSTVYKTGEPNRGNSCQITRKDGSTGFIEASISLVKNDSCLLYTSDAADE